MMHNNQDEDINIKEDKVAMSAWRIKSQFYFSNIDFFCRSWIQQ